MCRYTAFLARTLAPNSICQYLNCVRLVHLQCGLTNPLKDNWALQQVIKGIKKVHGRPPVQKMPITPSILRRMITQLNLEQPLHIVFWAACLVAFYSFCRKATLVPKSCGQMDVSAALLRGDVQWVSQGVIVNIRKTKTIQCNERVLQIPLHRQADTSLCPVAALRRMWLLPPPPADRPLFSYKLRDSLHILDYKTFTCMLSSIISASGIDSSLFSGHSLRRGGATYAFHCGVPPAYIKLQGDWRSDCWERYVHIPLDLRWKLSASMSAPTTDYLLLLLFLILLVHLLGFWTCILVDTIKHGVLYPNRCVCVINY